MTRSAARREELFVVRMWVESGADPEDWRATVSHVVTRERIAFTRFEDLAAFLIDIWARR